MLDAEIIGRENQIKENSDFLELSEEWSKRNTLAMSSRVQRQRLEICKYADDQGVLVPNNVRKPRRDLLIQRVAQEDRCFSAAWAVLAQQLVAELEIYQH